MLYALLAAAGSGGASSGAGNSTACPCPSSWWCASDVSACPCCGTSHQTQFCRGCLRHRVWWQARKCACPKRTAARWCLQWWQRGPWCQGAAPTAGCSCSNGTGPHLPASHVRPAKLCTADVCCSVHVWGTQCVLRCSQLPAGAVPIPDWRPPYDAANPACSAARPHANSQPAGRPTPSFQRSPAF